jgi:acyl carrier protein
LRGKRRNRYSVAPQHATITAMIAHDSLAREAGTGADMDTQTQVITILAEVLGLGSKAGKLNAHSPLLGAIPEFDSMAVLGLITRLEEVFGIQMSDDELSADTFESVGSLVRFISDKRRTS